VKISLIFVYSLISRCKLTF